VKPPEVQAGGPSLAEGERLPRERVVELVNGAQESIVAAFEGFEERARFTAHPWQRSGGGGGSARVLAGGDVFAKVAINVSAVSGGEVPASLAGQHPGIAGQPFFATGLSLIAHAVNPYVPSFHANYRYFEVAGGGTWWFGGGADLTPNYGFEEDARHFHSVLERQCAAYEPGLYRRLKRRCDEYFQLPHRGETRGIGGIFFDQLSSPVEQQSGADGVDGPAWQRDFAFVASGLAALTEAYLPIVERRQATSYGERQRAWQAHRRGRYVEFNLLYDRGTLFGLQTGGNIEAILASLPPVAAWSFGHAAESDSEEAKLADFLRPREWLGDARPETALKAGSNAQANVDSNTGSNKSSPTKEKL